MNSAITAAVSGSVGLICLVAAGLIWTVGRRHTPRLALALVITGMVGLAATPLGSWGRTAVGWLNDLVGQVAGRLTGTVVAGLLAAVLFYVVVTHVWRRDIDTKTLVAGGVLPLAVTSVPGSVGAVMSTGVFAVANVMGWGVGALFGLN